MEGLPISEIAKQLGISAFAVRQRFFRRKIQPIGYVGTAGLYKEEDIEQIREQLPRGIRSPNYVHKNL